MENDQDKMNETNQTAAPDPMDELEDKDLTWKT